MAVTLGPGTDSAGHVRPPARSTVSGRLRSDACLPAPRRPAGRPPRAAAPARRLREKRPPAKRSGNRRPRRRKKKSSHRSLGRASAAAGACSPAAPAAWPARSPGRTRPNRSRPSTAATASASAVLGLAIVLGAAAWSNGIGPVGVGLADGVRWIVGSLVMVLPVVLFFAALRLLRSGPRPEARGRLAIGWLCTVASVLGIAQILGTAADPQQGRARLRRPDRLGRRHAAGRRHRRHRHRRPAGAAGVLRPAGHHRDARCTRSPSGCASSATACSAADDYDDDDDEYDDDDDDDGGGPTRPPLRPEVRCRRTCSPPARSTSARSTPPPTPAITEPGRRCTPSCGRRWSTAPCRPRTCRRSPSPSS